MDSNCRPSDDQSPYNLGTGSSASLLSAHSSPMSISDDEDTYDQFYQQPDSLHSSSGSLVTRSSCSVSSVHSSPSSLPLELNVGGMGSTNTVSEFFDFDLYLNPGAHNPSHPLNPNFILAASASTAHKANKSNNLKLKAENPSTQPRSLPGSLPQAPLALKVSTGQEADAVEPDEFTARPGIDGTHYTFHAVLHENADNAQTQDDPCGDYDSEADAESDSDDGSAPSALSQVAEFDRRSSSFKEIQVPSQLSEECGEPEPPADAFSGRLQPHEKANLADLDRLKHFLASAPAHWDVADPESGKAAGAGTIHTGAAEFEYPSTSHPALNRFALPNLPAVSADSNSGNKTTKPDQGETSRDPDQSSPSTQFVSCVLWAGLYHITGTDIVKALAFRFHAFGRPVRNMKKFEEGVFSDLRNLKPGVDACLEEAKSPLLELLFRYQCVRTQKRQKVYYWYSVPHDRLFLDALERDLRREEMRQESTTVVVGEPALSFRYNPNISLYEQFSLRGIDPLRPLQQTSSPPSKQRSDRTTQASASSVFSMFEGSPAYKQRRKRPSQMPVLTKKAKLDKWPTSTWGTERSRAGGYVPVESGHNRSSSYGSSNDGDFDSVDDDTKDLELEFKGMSAAEIFMLQARSQLVPSSRHEREKTRRLLVRQQFADRHVFGREKVNYSNGLPPTSRIAESGHSTPNDGSPREEHESLDESDNQYTNDPFNLNQLMPTSRGFECPLVSCGRPFRRLEHLKRHIMVHTQERPHVCNQCSRKFSRQDNLKQHWKTHFPLKSDISGTEFDELIGEVTDQSQDSTPQTFHISEQSSNEQTSSQLPSHPPAVGPSPTGRLRGFSAPSPPPQSIRSLASHALNAAPAPRSDQPSPIRSASDGYVHFPQPLPSQRPSFLFSPTFEKMVADAPRGYHPYSSYNSEASPMNGSFPPLDWQNTPSLPKSGDSQRSTVPQAASYSQHFYRTDSPFGSPFNLSFPHHNTPVSFFGDSLAPSSSHGANIALPLVSAPDNLGTLPAEFDQQQMYVIAQTPMEYEEMDLRD